MTASQALTKLSIMLGLNTPVVVKSNAVEAQFASATLVDGTVVKTEGDLVVGATLFVVTPEGDVLAPMGIHQTEANQLVTVDDMGVITAIEDMAPEADTTEVVPASMEDVALPNGTMVPEVAVAEASVISITEEVVTAVAALIAPAIEQISTLQDEIAALKANFSAFKDEPAAKKITNNLTEYKQSEEAFTDARFEALKKIRSGKN